MALLPVLMFGLEFAFAQEATARSIQSLPTLPMPTAKYLEMVGNTKNIILYQAPDIENPQLTDALLKAAGSAPQIIVLLEREAMTNKSPEVTRLFNATIFVRNIEIRIAKQDVKLEPFLWINNKPNIMFSGDAIWQSSIEIRFTQESIMTFQPFLKGLQTTAYDHFTP